MNYESRLERLEQQVADPVAQRLIARLYDSDTRPADRMELQGQRFDRGADEEIDDFRRRVLDSLGLAERNVTIVSYVGSNRKGSPRFPADVDLSDDQASVEG